jgi:cobyrinic acid a,c-diamide synthase
MFLKELESNQSMRKSISQASEKGMPIYAECAGLMYMTQSIADFDGKSYSMVGALEGKTKMTGCTLIAYVTAEVVNTNILSDKASSIKGHEFHNSVITEIPVDTKFAYNMLMGQGIKDRKDGWIKNNILASYMHIHFAQNKEISRSFVEKCRIFRERS